MPWPGSSSSNNNKNKNNNGSNTDNDDDDILTRLRKTVLEDHKSSPNDRSSPPHDWSSTLNWSHYTEPRTLVPAVILTSVSLFTITFYRSFLRRIPTAAWIPPNYLRRRSLFGKVTSIGDGDNFRMYHTPGGRLAGWGWFPGRFVPKEREALREQTIHVRLAGIDAPELAHFGRPAQPHSTEALTWLTTYLQNRHVRAYLHRADQYGRVVATVYVRRFLGLIRQDVSLQMLKGGLATVYEAKSGAEFGGAKTEKKYREMEKKAKRKGRGLWGPAGKGGEEAIESPREYKAKYAAEEAEKERGVKEARLNKGKEGERKPWWKFW